MSSSVWLAARDLLYQLSMSQDSTYHSLCYTSRGTLAGMGNSSMGPPWRIDPMTHQTMSERSYHGATSCYITGARCSSVVRAFAHGSMGCRMILHGVDPLNYFSFQPVHHNWCNKGRGMCYPVCGMVHIKDPLLLIGKSSPGGGSGFPFSLSSEWSFTICPTPYNRKIQCVECVVN